MAHGGRGDEVAYFVIMSWPGSHLVTAHLGRKCRWVTNADGVAPVWKVPLVSWPASYRENLQFRQSNKTTPHSKYKLLIFIVEAVPASFETF